MPSNSYIHYVCWRIPDVVCKHKKEKFLLTEELADLYLGLHNYAEETCRVVNRLLEDKLIKKIPSHKAGRSRSRARTFVEAQRRITLKTGNHL